MRMYAVEDECTGYILLVSNRIWQSFHSASGLRQELPGAPNAILNVPGTGNIGKQRITFSHGSFPVCASVCSETLEYPRKLLNNSWQS